MVGYIFEWVCVYKYLLNHYYGGKTLKENCQLVKINPFQLLHHTVIRKTEKPTLTHPVRSHCSPLDFINISTSSVGPAEPDPLPLFWQSAKSHFSENCQNEQIERLVYLGLVE